MTIATGLMAFAILWWLVFFMVLPFGVKTEEEAGGATVEGHAPSAPNKPRLVMKAVITTIISAAIFLVVYLIFTSGIIDLRGYLKSGT